MNALARTDYAAWSLSEAVVADLIGKGAYLFDERLDVAACAGLLEEIAQGGRFDQSLFLGEAAFTEAANLRAGAKPGRNVLDTLANRLGFIERAPQLVEALWSLLGPDYRLLEREAVCVLPASAIPSWIQRRIHEAPGQNLSRFLRPERRGLTCRQSLEPHRDLRLGDDHPADVVLLDVYLHAVADTEAPLVLLDGSHRRQAVVPRVRRALSCVSERVLTGDAGFAVLRHAGVLCGDLPGAEHPRVSLRYRFGRGTVRAAGIDSVNAAIAVP